MTSPAFGGGNVLYKISRDDTHMEIGEIKVISKIRKVKKIGVYKFNTIGIT